MQEPLKAWVDSRDKRKGDASEAVAHRLVYWQMGDPEPPTPCKSPGAAQTPGSRACHSTADYNNQVSKVRRVLAHCSRHLACRHCHRHLFLPLPIPARALALCTCLACPMLQRSRGVISGGALCLNIMGYACYSQEASYLPQSMSSGACYAGGRAAQGAGRGQGESEGS